jgi:drug/metabolite transporter (DMT)-like permease
MPMDYTSLVWAALLGLVVFGDWPHPATWAGGTVIILSGLIILWREQRLHRARLASGEADAA